MDEPLYFERTMKLFFGEQAYQIAEVVNNKKERRKWLKKAIKQMMKIVNMLDAPIKHKECLMNTLVLLNDEIKMCDIPSWYVIDILFRLCARLFGFNNMKGSKLYSLVYWQNEAQYQTEKTLEGYDQDLYYIKKNAIILRKDLINHLKSKGIDSFTIALTFNTTEYAIKKILKNCE